MQLVTGTTLNGKSRHSAGDVVTLKHSVPTTERCLNDYIRSGCKADVAAALIAAGLGNRRWELTFERAVRSKSGPRLTVRNATAFVVFLILRPGNNKAPAIFRLSVPRDTVDNDGKPVTADQVRERLLAAVGNVDADVDDEETGNVMPPAAENVTEDDVKTVLEAVQTAAAARGDCDWPDRSTFTQAVCMEIGFGHSPERWGGVMSALTNRGLLADRGTFWGITKSGKAWLKAEPVPEEPNKKAEEPVAEKQAIKPTPVLTTKPATVSSPPPASSPTASSMVGIMAQAAKLKASMKALDDLEVAQQMINELDFKIAGVRNRESEIQLQAADEIAQIQLKMANDLSALQNDLVDLEKQKLSVQEGASHAAQALDPAMLRMLANQVEATAQAVNAAVKGS